MSAFYLAVALVIAWAGHSASSEMEWEDRREVLFWSLLVSSLNIAMSAIYWFNPGE